MINNNSVYIPRGVEAYSQPRNWQETLLRRVVDPANCRATQIIHLIALIALGILFSIVTLGLGALCFRSFTLIYSDYQQRVKSGIDSLAATRIQSSITNYLNQKHQLDRDLQSWVEDRRAYHDERRAEAKAAIMASFCRRSPTLNLSRLNLSNLPPEIAQLKHLEVLSLMNNQLTSLPSEVFALQRLEQLSLDHNRLTSASLEGIGNLTNLKNLSLSDNLLTSVPIEVSNLSGLQYLTLSRNRLTSLPEGRLFYLNLSRLEHLYLNGNILTEIPTGTNALHRARIHVDVRYLSDECYSNPDLHWSIRGNGVGMRIPNEVIDSAEIGPPMTIQWDVWPLRTNVDRPSFSRNIVKDNGQQLLSAIAFWQSYLPNQEWPDFKLLNGHMYTPQLIRFLERLVEASDYKQSKKGEVHFAERVMRILRSMVTNEDFRGPAFAEIDEAVTTCGDRIALGFDNVEILWYLFEGGKNKSPLELAVLAIGLLRLEKIKEIVSQRPIYDKIEAELFLRVRLVKKLKLPIATRSMLYASAISEHEIPSIGTTIQKSTSSKEVVIVALLRQKFWRSYLREVSEAYLTVTNQITERKDLKDDGKRALLYEELENLYKADTLKWYDDNKNQLNSLLITN